MISNYFFGIFAICMAMQNTIAIPALVDQHQHLLESNNTNTSSRPIMRLYNKYPEEPTFTVVTAEPIESIIKYWEDLNNVDGFCATGTWLTYSMSGYTNGGVGGLIFSNDSMVCAGRFWPAVASVRFAGSPTNIHAKTLTTYTGEGYRGNDTVYTSESNVTQPFVSFIITGDYPITFYSRENFGGFAMCVDAPQNRLGGGLRNVNLLGLLPGEIKSFKFSCDPTLPRKQLEKNYG